ncbi:MAG: glycosyltransferase involved in cell wall biosynthesis [Cryomorphaceae bacterium]|jgi:glycosyltransferase involved in cell wall biosynthesis
MKILFLTTQLPYPPFSGGVIKTWNLVKHWSSNDLMLVCALKEGEENHMAEFQEKVPNVELFTIPFDRKRTPLNLLRSYFTAPSLNVFRNYNKQLDIKVKEWAPQCDLIFVDHYEMGQYVHKSFGKPVVLHEHNAEFVMWERLAEIENNPIKKALIKLEAGRIKRAEKMYAEDASIVFAAPNDIEELAKIGVDRDKLKPTYHLGEDFLLERPDLEFDQTEKALLFVGTLTWEANVDGLIWFLDEIYPLVLKNHPDIHFYIVGKNPDQRLISRAQKFDSVELTGFVEELEPYFKKARAFVIPLRFGSGIKVKLLNAMYRGIPIVTTPIGTEGLEVVSGRDLFCTQSEEEQVAAITTLVESKSKWESLRNHSREIAKNYTWKKLLSDHDEVINSLTKKKESEQ